MSENIDHIVKQCKKGKRKFQSQLYHLFAERLNNAALRYGQNEASVRDHVHDAFLKIFTNIKSYKGKGYQIYNWMLRIVINEILQQKRRDQKIVFVENYEEEETEDGLELVMAKMSFEEIWDLIKSMDYNDQLIINLSIVDEMSHKEIAEILNITVQNSRTKLSRAKANLRTLIIQQRTIKDENF